MMSNHLLRCLVLVAAAWSGGGFEVRHDMGTGDYGAEKWKKHTAETLGKVTRVPRDFPTLHEAVETVLRVPKESFKAQRTLVALDEGSFLIPHKFKEVAVSKDGWQYAQSHQAIFLDGKKTRALVPDDGAEPEESPKYACMFLPTRDTRFLNITGPLQLIGARGMRSRVCGAWRFHADGSTGCLRELCAVNQKDCVVVVTAGDWNFDRCLLSAMATSGHGTDILVASGSSTILIEHCTLEPLRHDPPSPRWAAWPPGSPRNQGGFQGRSLLPADLNHSPQGGFAMFGMHLSGTVKCIVDSSTFQGLVGAVAAMSATDTSLDNCTMRWNQYGTILMDAAAVSLRRCTLVDNVYGACGLFQIDDAESTSLNLLHNQVQGPLWTNKLRPAQLREAENEVRESPREFRAGPGVHATITPPEPWTPGSGHWETNWEKAEGYSKYPDEDGTPSGGVGTLMKEMSKTQRNAPGANPQFDFSKIFQ